MLLKEGPASERAFSLADQQANHPPLPEILLRPKGPVVSSHVRKGVDRM